MMDGVGALLNWFQTRDTMFRHKHQNTGYMSVGTGLDSGAKVLRDQASGRCPEMQIQHKGILTESSAVSLGKGHAVSVPWFPT